MASEALIISNAKMTEVATALNVTPQQLLAQFVPNADKVGAIFAYIDATGVTVASHIEANAIPGTPLDPTLVQWAIELYVLGGQGLAIARP